MTNKELATALDRLTNIVERMPPPVPAIPQIPAIPAIPAIAPIPHSTDHDIINALVVSVQNLDQKFTEKFADLKISIQNLKNDATNDVTASRQELITHITEDNKMHNNHEDRIRTSELEISVIKTKIVVWGTAGIILLGVVEFALNKYF